MSMSKSYNNNFLLRDTSKKMPRKQSKLARARKDEKLVILRELGRFAPDRMRVNLIYQDSSATRTVTGTSQAMNWQYRSSAYDPDPLVLTGAIPGYAELANLYYEYCVHGMYLELELANQDTQAYVVVTWPGNSSISNNSLTLADIAEFSGNVRADSKMVGTVNGISLCKLNSAAVAQQLIGDRYKTDLDYSSSTSTNPVKMYYLNVGVYSPSANIGFPVITRARIVYDVEFFTLRQLES